MDDAAGDKGSAIGVTTIRRASVDDARAIATIATRGWQTAYRGILPGAFLDRLNVDTREQAWRTLLAGNVGERGATWIAEDARGPVGFVSSGPPRDDDAGAEAVEVYAIYVMPDRWRTGAGRALLRTATEHWRSAGARVLLLWVLEENDRARRFYEALGWRPDGGRQEFRIGDVVAMELRYRHEAG